MAAPSGLDAIVQYGVETTHATFATPTRRLEFTEESLSLTEERIESGARRSGSRILPAHRWKRNRKGIEGDTNHEVTSSGFGLLFEHMLGATATATPVGATDARTHTATIGALTGTSMSIQAGRPDTTGTVQPFSYLGCKVASWEFSVNDGDPATSKRNSTAVETLLTFCPPGPLARTKRSCNSESGMAMEGVMRSTGEFLDLRSVGHCSERSCLRADGLCSVWIRVDESRRRVRLRGGGGPRSGIAARGAP